MKEQYVVNLKGKQYPTYQGVLDEAHEKGLTRIETDLVQIPSEENTGVAIVKARVFLGEKVYEAYGDASSRNVNKMIVYALIRMAETRAKGRALRDAINVGQTMLEELPDDNTPEEQPKPPTEAPVASQGTTEPVVQACSTCNVAINDAVMKYSMDYYKKPLCRDHQ